MIHLTKAAIARWLDRLLHTHDTPHRTALAFATGVLIGFSPLLGVHTLIALILAFAFNLNRVAVLLGAYANLPWFMGPYYAVATILGARLIGAEMPPGFLAQMRVLLSHWRLTDLTAAIELLRPLVWAYTLGSTLLAITAALVAYRTSLAFILARKRHREHHGPGH
jgi:hypothetical protein